MYVKDNLNGIPIGTRHNPVMDRYMCEDVEAVYLDIRINTCHFLLEGYKRSYMESMWDQIVDKSFSSLGQQYYNHCWWF